MMLTCVRVVHIDRLYVNISSCIALCTVSFFTSFCSVLFCSIFILYFSSPGGVHAAGADGWKTGAIERLSKTELYDELQRLVGHCLVVFKCPDMNYDLDNTALNYTIYR